jgi:Protein of unknown function (DUF1593)
MTIESQASLVETFQGKPRVFVLTDIGNEPDDQMSLTRFLLYSNDFETEGLVAVTSTWQREKVSPEIIQKVVCNYGKVRTNLLKHADGSTPDGGQYSSATWTGISGDKYYRNAPGADFTTVSNKWLDQHVRSKGSLGETYPQYLFIMEGDTPTFLGLIQNGLVNYRNPGWGGWGGRYILRQPAGESRPIWTQGGDPYPGSPNSRDSVIGVDGQRYTSDQATIWRWRKAFQHDFSARMDWTLKEFKDANHNPVVVVNGDSSKQPIWIDAKIGAPMTLNASGTSDPDGHQVKYHWWYYEEAASAISKPVQPQDIRGKRGEDELGVLPKVKIEGSEEAQAKVIPQSAGLAHVILAVEDDGEPSPNLVSQDHPEDRELRSGFRKLTN